MAKLGRMGNGEGDHQGVNLPALGFRTKPPIPLPIPLMRPAAPSFSAPRSGCVINPEMPS